MKKNIISRWFIPSSLAIIVIVLCGLCATVLTPQNVNASQVCEFNSAPSNPDWDDVYSSTII